MTRAARHPPLAAAFALSVVLHVLLLMAVRVGFPGVPGVPGEASRVLNVQVLEGGPAGTGAGGAPAAPPPQPAHVPPEPTGRASASPAPPVPAAPSVQQPAPTGAAPGPDGARPNAEPSAQAPRLMRGAALAVAGTEGHAVRVSLSVGADGRVEEVAVGPTEMRTEGVRALQAVLSAWRFQPARQDGKALPAQVRMRLCFDAQGALHAPEPDCWDPATGR